MSQSPRNAPAAWSRSPRFVPRQTLTAERLNDLNAAPQRHLQLLMRALHGHGVVFGLAVETAERDRALEVSCGLALDRHGRTLYWGGGKLSPRDFVGRPPSCEGKYTLTIHYARRHIGGDGCGPCPDEPEWIEEGVVFRLEKGCEDAERDCPCIPGDACIGLDSYVCDRTGSRRGPVRRAPDIDGLCEEPPELCPLDDCGWAYDREAGIPLACVEVVDLTRGDDCEPCWGFDCVAPCAVRPISYRNPLLFELIRGCHVDLGWIADISWRRWFERPFAHEVPWADFERRMGAHNGFLIRFEKPIAVETLHEHSIFLTAYVWDHLSDYWLPQRIPIRVVPLNEHDGYATVVRLERYQEWWEAEIDSRRSSLFSGVDIELTVRGQLLRDHCCNMLDARLRGYSPERHGQERPGDDFVAVFRVAPKWEDKPEKPKDRRWACEDLEEDSDEDGKGGHGGGKEQRGERGDHEPGEAEQGQRRTKG